MKCDFCGKEIKKEDEKTQEGYITMCPDCRRMANEEQMIEEDFDDV